jgi:hypothetical protein
MQTTTLALAVIALILAMFFVSTFFVSEQK